MGIWSNSALAAALAVTALGSGTAQAQNVSLRVHLWASPKHMINAEIIPEWCRQVVKATEGRVKCSFSYPPGAAPQGMFDRVRDGVADMAWGLQSYSPGRFVASQVAELPGVQGSGVAMTVAFWRTHKKYLDKADEYRGVQLIGLMLTRSAAIQSKMPVRSLADLKGAKMRVPGGVALGIARRLDINGISAPANKVYELLQQGVIQGTMIPPETALSFRLVEVTKYMTLVPGGLYYSGFYFIMNDRTFRRISEKDRKAIMAVSGENYARIAGKAFDRWDPIGIEGAKKAGVEVSWTDKAFTTALQEKLAPLTADWIAAVAKKGIDGSAARAYFKSQTALVDKE